MRHRIVSLLLVIMLVPAFALPAASQSDKTELTVWMAASHTGPEWEFHWEKIKAEFEEKNPGFTIVQTTDGFSFGPDAWIPRVIAGVGPDVGLIRGSTTYEMYHAGILKNLNEYVERTPDLAPSNFLPSSNIFGNHDGVTYGIPWSFEARIIAYDTRHFQEVGLDSRPETLATWDDLVRHAQILTQVRGDDTIARAGLKTISPTRSRFLEAMYANGTYHVTDDGAPNFDTPEALEALEFIVDLKNHNIMSSGSIPAGTASMEVRDTSALYRPFHPVDPNFGEWLSIAPYPKGPSTDSPKSFSWSNLWAIPFNAKYPDQSWSFIEIWMSLENQVHLFEARQGTNVLSPRLDFFQSNAFHDSLIYLPFFAQIPDVFTNAVPMPYIRADDINGILTEQLSMVANGSLSPAATLEEIDRRLTSLFRGEQ